MSTTPATSPFFAVGTTTSRTRRPAVIGFVLMSLALTLGIQRVVLAAPHDGSAQGALEVRGIDGNGRVSSSADVINVSGAYPGMASQTSTFEVRNTGTPVAFAVESTGLVANGPRSLDDVLRIAVRDRATGAEVYRGRLSRLRIAHTGTLAAGAVATFTVEVTWPATSADAAYQGAGMGFTVTASPAAA
jgi:hypothetical protein